MNTNLDLKVSCITSMTGNYEHLIKIIGCYVKQDYLNLELIIIDSGGDCFEELIPECELIHYLYKPEVPSQDEIFNMACEKATGEIIVHMDEECCYANDWVSCQVNALMSAKADICGLNKKKGFPVSLDMEEKKPDQVICWISASTLCYWKSIWTIYPFRRTEQDTITDFVLNAGTGIYVHNYSGGHRGTNNFIPIPKKRTVFPLVSCIMTTKDLKTFHKYGLKVFLCQDYPNLEFIIIDDGKKASPELLPDLKIIKYVFINDKINTGAKKNMACKMSKGNIIINWTDQDWYETDWITHQVSSLLTSGAEISGLDLVHTYSLDNNKFMTQKKEGTENSWLYGPTMIYWKSIWEKTMFIETHTAEDEDFLYRSKARIFAHKYIKGYYTNIHLNLYEDILKGNDQPSLN